MTVKKVWDNELPTNRLFAFMSGDICFNHSRHVRERDVAASVLAPRVPPRRPLPRSHHDRRERQQRKQRGRTRPDSYHNASGAQFLVQGAPPKVPQERDPRLPCGRGEARGYPRRKAAAANERRVFASASDAAQRSVDGVVVGADGPHAAGEGASDAGAPTDGAG